MSKINATKAHELADNFHDNGFRDLISENHSRIRRLAEAGKYEHNIVLPIKLMSRLFDATRYFQTFGFRVTVEHNTLRVSW